MNPSTGSTRRLRKPRGNGGQPSIGVTSRSCPSAHQEARPARTPGPARARRRMRRPASLRPSSTCIAFHGSSSEGCDLATELLAPSVELAGDEHREHDRRSTRRSGDRRAARSPTARRRARGSSRSARGLRTAATQSGCAVARAADELRPEADAEPPRVGAHLVGEGRGSVAAPCTGRRRRVRRSRRARPRCRARCASARARASSSPSTRRSRARAWCGPAWA